MRFLGLLFVMASVFGFLNATKAVHDELPKLIVDAPLREAVEQCIAKAHVMLVLGFFAVAVGVLFLAIGEAKAEAHAVERNLVARVKEIEKRVTVLERENAYKDELLGRIQALEEKSRTRAWPTP